MGIFDQAALQKAIDQELAAIPAGHSRCLVGYYTLDGRWRVSYAQRISNRWTFGATFERDQAAGAISGGVSLRGSW